MKYTRLGKFKVSIVGIGAWQAGQKSWGRGSRGELIKTYRNGFDNGINLIDTAEIYGWGRSERIVGEAVKGYSDVVVATKIAGCFFHPVWIRKRVKGSLRRLGLKTIPLYQVHWPPSIYSRLCPGFRVLEELVEEVLIESIGVSNFNRGEFIKANNCLEKEKIVSNQVEYSLVQRAPERELLPVLEEYGAKMIAWGPLAKGALAGKKKIDNIARLTDPKFHRARKDERLLGAIKTVAEEEGVSMATIAIAWIINKGIIPIVGARRKKHIDSLIEAAELNLKQHQLRLLDEASRKYLSGGITRVTLRIMPDILYCGILWLIRGA